ncbi:MAG: hypothetical protein ONA90_02460, partial [candidate division KSB1 bacterium]|nr:hypothetical protein [candidate division KSB1 bacterium]
QRGDIVRAMKCWRILVGCFLAVTLGAAESRAAVYRDADESISPPGPITKVYKSAATVWEHYRERTPLRQRLLLHGTWQAASDDHQLPAEVQIPGAFSFEGEVVFQRRFEMDSTFANRPLRLVFEGAHYITEVEMNGQFAGRHEGGYTPFVIDLRPGVVFFDQENVLTVRVSNRLSPLQTLPAKHRPLGWLNEGGMLREIYLEALPTICIEQTRFSYEFDQQRASIKLEAELRVSKEVNEEGVVSAVIELWDANRLRRLTTSAPVLPAAGDKLHPTVSLGCQLEKPMLWSPATPHLYAVRLMIMQQKTIVDEKWEEIGFRKIEMVDKQFHLNGEPFMVRGVNWFEYYGDDSALLDTAYARQLLQQVKELGANTIRLVGRPPHPLLPTLCDRNGLFLLEELPLYYLTSAHLRQPQFLNLALLQSREMILRDRHHPSVLGWGLGTHLAAPTAHTINILQAICQEWRRLDQRPIYVVSPVAWLSVWEPWVDFLLPDWFEQKSVEPLAQASAASQKPLLPIIGFWMRRELSRHDQIASSPTHSISEAEQAQAEMLDKLLEGFEQMQPFSGYFVQALKDWPGHMPLLALGATPTPLHLKPVATVSDDPAKKIFLYSAGLLDHRGQRRLAFNFVQVFNQGERRPMLMIKPTGPVHPQEYPIVGIGVLLILLFYLNRDRRLRANLHRVFVHPHGFYVDIFENRKTPPFLTALIGLAECCILATLFSGFCYAYRDNFIFDQLLNLLIDDPMWKSRMIWLIWHPTWFIVIGTGVLFLAGVAATLFLRFLGFFLGRSLPTVQYFTFIFWTAANFLTLAILAPFFYRLLLFSGFTAPMVFIVISTLLWCIGRFFRGMRVVYALTIPRTLIIFTLLFGGLIFSVALYYDRTQAIFQYAEYYWQLLNAGI